MLSILAPDRGYQWAAMPVQLPEWTLRATSPTDSRPSRCRLAGRSGRRNIQARSTINPALSASRASTRSSSRWIARATGDRGDRDSLLRRVGEIRQKGAQRSSSPLFLPSMGWQDAYVRPAHPLRQKSHAPRPKRAGLTVIQRNPAPQCREPPIARTRPRCTSDRTTGRTPAAGTT
jgi:hypothetical protein